MELLWIALFGLLCAVILGLLWACERWLAVTPVMAKATGAGAGGNAGGAAK